MRAARKGKKKELLIGTSQGLFVGFIQEGRNFKEKENEFYFRGENIINFVEFSKDQIAVLTC